MISIRGIAIEQTNEGADQHIDKLAKKYLGVDKYPMRSPDEKKNYSKNKTKKGIIFHIHKIKYLINRRFKYHYEIIVTNLTRF